MLSNILVTGGGGFIGSHLCEALVLRGDRVRALVHYNGCGHAGRLEDVPPEIRDAIEVILADITDPYAVRDLVRGRDVICRSFDLPVVTVRPFNTYGPRQSAGAIIPTIITQALRSGEVRLGALEPTRDLTFVTDTVVGMVAAADAPDVVGETINIGTGDHISIGDLATRLFELLSREGVNAHMKHDTDRIRPSGSEVEHLCADPSKAKRLLGWEPQVALNDGLAATIAAISADIESYPRVGTYQR